ncbi:hypothetical protein M0R45_035326 [Rubus argutus]|uniref:Secreted protein n=1 Tax=Rubus argutus TaxID=59490 RepID=A0AAW1VTV9_RUBAR
MFSSVSSLSLLFLISSSRSHFISLCFAELAAWTAVGSHGLAGGTPTRGLASCGLGRALKLRHSGGHGVGDGLGSVNSSGGLVIGMVDRFVWWWCCLKIDLRWWFGNTAEVR